MDRKCDYCGNDTFFADAHVVQTWVVDSGGHFLEVAEDCSEVTHEPDEDDIWTCQRCGKEYE